jgi:RimJ/RimL family protein N-acetyltransferase/protein associated with RNAse G/E
MSQSVLYQAFKYNGALNYRWQTQLEYTHDNLIILYTPAGVTYTGRRSGVFPYGFHSYLWTDRWFNVNQTLRSDEPVGIWHYVNLAMPAQFAGNAISFVDLDLDYWLDPQWQLKLEDEDEYRAHSQLYHYTPFMREQIARAMQHIQRLATERAWPFAGVMRGERLWVRPFRWSDLEAMDRWSGAWDPFDDPWLIPLPGEERREWYSGYLETPICRLYAITDQAQQVIGHISLREIVRGQHARLGIGLAPTQKNKGYGTEALRTFLPYYFEVLGFQKMVLDVAASNQGAVRVYQKLGFHQYAQYYRGAGSDAQWRVLDEPRYAALRPFFQRNYWGLQQLHYDMELTREQWYQQVNGHEAVPQINTLR